MPRGRLIFPFMVDIARLDTDATAADPDGAGPLEYGFDDDFREPVIVPPTNATSSERGTVHRVESLVQLPAQIESDGLEQLGMMATGQSPDSLIKVVLHFRDLEAAGLVDPSGVARLRVNDRLDAIKKFPTLELVRKFRNPPGLFCIEALDRSYGLGTDRNLLLMTFQERATSANA